MRAGERSWGGGAEERVVGKVASLATAGGWLVGLGGQDAEDGFEVDDGGGELFEERESVVAVTLWRVDFNDGGAMGIAANLAAFSEKRPGGFEDAAPRRVSVVFVVLGAEMR